MMFRISDIECKCGMDDEGEVDTEEPLNDNTGDLIVSPGGYNVMQYIGIKDRNGTEIYEGDILSAFVWSGGHGGGKEFKGVVVYKEAGFVLECKLKTAINPYILNFMNQRITTKPETIFEVLGNIYENPDIYKQIFKSET